MSDVEQTAAPQHADDARNALEAFHEARERRLELMRDGADDLSDVVQQEREAIVRHAAAIRAHEERIARLGR